MSKRLMPTYLVNFLKEIYDGTIPSNFGERMVSRQFIASVKTLYETLGGDNPSDYSRRMVNEYLIKFFNEIEIVEYTDDDVKMTKDIPSDLVYSACRVDSIGGMSYKVDDTIQDSAVTAVKSYGANLFDDNGTDSIQYIGHYYTNTGAYNYSLVSNTNFNCFRVSVKENTTYYIKQVGNLVLRYEDSSNNVIGGTDSLYSNGYGSFTTSSGCAYVVFSKGVSSILQTMLNYGSTAIPYKPYRGLIDTYTIPSAITSLEGYGQSNPDDQTVFNEVNFIDGKYYEKGYIDNGVWVSKEAEISITEQAPLLEVEEGGSIVFENEYNQDMPNEVTTWIKGN